MASEAAAPKWRTIAFRDALLLHLHKHGLPSATPAIPADLSGRDRLMHDSGVIDGLPSFAVSVHRQQGMELASSLDAATALAATTGKQHAACVHYRRGRSADDPGASYVVMTLDDFASVLALIPQVRTQPPNDARTIRQATAAVG